VLEHKINETFGDEDPTAFATGWWSGILWVDQVFGTYDYPQDRWPDTYGLHEEKIPSGFWGQTFYPFTSKWTA